MGIEMGTEISTVIAPVERKVKLSIDELRAQLIELQPKIEGLLQLNDEVPLALYKAYYDTFGIYIDPSNGPDKVITDQKRSELATLFRLAKKAVDAGHGEAHHKEWH
jgi:hypothetical protein